MSLGKMSRWLAVRRSSTKEDARRGNPPNRLLRHHSESEIGDLATHSKTGDMRIMQLQQSPSAVRRPFPSPSNTPAPSEQPPATSSNPSPAIPSDSTMDSFEEEEEFPDPRYAMPSFVCSKPSTSCIQPRTSTPLHAGVGVNAVGLPTPVTTPSPSSTMNSDRPSDSIIAQERRENAANRAQGYAVVCPDEVRSISASLPRNDSISVVVDESVFTGPIRKEDYLRKLGHRLKGWKRRWVALHGTEISFFKTIDVTYPSRVIMTSEIVDVFYPASVTYPGGHVFEVVTSKRSHILAAKTESGARTWVAFIQRASGRTRRSASVQAQNSGRSSSQSGTASSVDNTDIEPYAQAVFPARGQPKKAAEPMYAIASRTSPARKFSDSNIPCNRHISEEDDVAPPIIPPRAYGEDDDSSDDETCELFLDESQDAASRAPRGHLSSNGHTVGSIPSSHTLVVGSTGQELDSMNKSTLVSPIDYNCDDGVVVFF